MFTIISLCTCLWFDREEVFQNRGEYKLAESTEGLEFQIMYSSDGVKV